MSGSVKQFVDYSNNTNNDTGENTPQSIQRINNGEGLDETVLRRPSESLRQRTEALRNVAGDSLYLRDADRKLVTGGPGKVTWPGSTTVAATGIPVLSDVLYIMPMLTPGFAQAAPIPPVASAYGVIHLKRVTGLLNSIAVTSMRRSYAAGDQINITVTPGAVFSCTLDAENGYERTIKIVATPTTQLSTVITALNGLTPTAPDNTQLVNAALEGGALGTDLILTTQAKQYMVGNYDGEGHTITPANLAAFFTGNPGSALAEGDTLCVQYDMVTDTASTGGRRQALPENANTAVPVGSFFNSRVNPEKLVNALPICKVINNVLVFDTGAAVPAGAVAAPITGDAANLNYAGGPNWADGTTNPATTVEGQLDKIISDLAGAAGTGKIQGSVSGTELAAATLASQLRSILAKTLGWITIADGVNYFGDFNVNAYPNANALLTAAIAALPAGGGRIYLKKGVALSNFNGATVALPANKTVEIIGEHNSVPSTPQITFATGEGLVCSATGKLILRNLNISSDGAEIPVTLTTSPCEVYDCYFQNTGALATSDANPFFKGTNVSDLTMERVQFVTTAMPASANGNPIVLIITGTAYRIFLSKIRYSNPTGDGMSGIRIEDVRSHVVIEDYSYDITPINSFGAAGLVLGSTDNTTDIHNRNVLRYTAKGEYSFVLLDPSIGHLTVDRMIDKTSAGWSCGTYSGSGPLVFQNCEIYPSIQNFNGSFDDIRFIRCDFHGLTISIGTTGNAFNHFTMAKNRFFGGNFGSITLTASSVSEMLIEENEFSGYTNSTNANFAMFLMQGSANNWACVRILRNRIKNFQNVSYVGGDAVNTPRLFHLRVQSAGMVEVSGNICTDVMVTSGANTIAAGYLFFMDSYDSTDQAVTTPILRMYDNQVGSNLGGGNSSNMGLLRAEHLIWDLVDLRRNYIWTEWNTAAGTPHAPSGFGVFLRYNASFSGSGKQGFIFEDNDIHIENTSAATITQDLIFIQAIGVPVFQLFSFQRNKIMTTTSQVWTAGLGCSITAPQYITCMVCENSTARDGTNAPIQFFTINHSTFNFAYFPSHAPPPAVNSAWDSNCFIFRGPV